MRGTIEWLRSAAIICLVGAGWPNIGSDTVRTAFTVIGLSALGATAVLSMFEKQKEEDRIEKLEKRMRGDNSDAEN